MNALSLSNLNNDMFMEIISFMEIPELVAVASTCSTYWVQLTAKIQAVLKISFYRYVETINLSPDDNSILRKSFCEMIHAPKFSYDFSHKFQGEITIDDLYKWCPKYLCYLLSLTQPVLSFLKMAGTPATKIMIDVRHMITFRNVPPTYGIIIGIDYDDGDDAVVTSALTADESILEDSGEVRSAFGYVTPLYYFKRECIDKFVKLDLSNLPIRYDLTIIL